MSRVFIDSRRRAEHSQEMSVALRICYANLLLQIRSISSIYLEACNKVCGGEEHEETEIINRS